MGMCRLLQMRSQDLPDGDVGGAQDVPEVCAPQAHAETQVSVRWGDYEDKPAPRALVAGLGGALAVVPTWREQGIDVTVNNWRMVAGPKDLSAAQIAHWETVLRRAVDTGEWKPALVFLRGPGGGVVVVAGIAKGPDHAGRLARAVAESVTFPPQPPPDRRLLGCFARERSRSQGAGVADLSTVTRRLERCFLPDRRYRATTEVLMAGGASGVDADQAVLQAHGDALRVGQPVQVTRPGQLCVAKPPIRPGVERERRVVRVRRRRNENAAAPMYVSDE